MLQKSATGRLYRFQNHGLVTRPAVGNGCNQTCHLKWCCQVKPLPDGQRKGFAFLPRNAGTLFFPGRGGYKAAGLPVQVDAGGRTQAAGFGIPGQTVHTQPLAYLVKKYITGLGQSLGNVDRPVASLFPAAVGAIAESVMARAKKFSVPIDDALFQPGQCRDDLIR